MPFHPTWSASTVLLAALMSLLLMTKPAHAEWQLDPEQSRVEATIVEITPTGPVPHSHQVRRLQGSVNDQGRLSLPLSLRQTDIIERLGELPPWLSGLGDSTLATVVAELPPERLNNLAVGESVTETLMLGVQSDGEHRREPLLVRLTHESEGLIRVQNAERVALDGRELMSNQTVRSILLMLGYEQIGDEVPVELNATLIDR